MVMNIPHPTCPMALARQWFFIIPLTLRFSVTMTWLSSTILRESLCRKSSRQLAILRCTFATFLLALLRLLEPFCFLDSYCCLSFKFFSYLVRNLGLSNLEASLVIAKWVKPTSIPTAFPSVDASGFSLPSSNKIEAKY